MSRRILAVLLMLVLVGCSAKAKPDPEPVEYGPDVGKVESGLGPAEPLPSPEEFEPPPRPEPPKEEPPPPGSMEYELDEELKLRVLAAVGAMPSVRRTVQLLRRTGGTWAVASEVNVRHLPGETITVRPAQLGGHANAFVLEARRSSGVRHGAVALVDGQLVALDYHRLVAPKPEIAQGVFLHLNKYMNQLWVYKDGALVATYPTANGRDPWGKQPTWQDLKTNYKTPEGLFPIKQKIVNPPYNSLGGNHPPAAGGAPDNPLGTRWMGFEVLEGDGGGIWGFHGTYVPWQIGTWASEGCVRLNTADAEALFELVRIGTMVRIVSGR